MKIYQILSLLVFLSNYAYSNPQFYVQGNTSDFHFKNYIPFVTINVYDNSTNNLIGSTQSNSTGEWSFSDTIVSINQNDLIINEYNLSNAYPNPFNPSTNITFNTKKTSSFNLEVFNIVGQKLYSNSTELATGSYKFNITGLGKAGIYFFRISNSDISLVNKLVLLDGGSTNNINIEINNSSITNNFAKVSSSEWRLEFTKNGFFTKDTIISIPNYDLLQIHLNQIPRIGTMNLSGQLTAQPTGAKADATAVNINGNKIITNNGFFESDVALSYITNQADTTDKKFTPNKIDFEFFGDDYFTNTTNIDAELGNIVVNSDINQKQISKNANANISIVDENENAISGSSIKIYKASNDSLMFSGNPENVSLSYSGFNFDDDATFNNIGSVRVEGSANGYVTNSQVLLFSNPMSSDIVLAQSKKNISVTGQVIDNKFGTVVQNDVAALIDKANGAVYASDNNSSDGISLTGLIPELSDVEVRITNPTASYSNKFIDISEESQNLGNINREQIPVLVTMTGQGSVTAKPTNYTQASNVNVNFAGNNVTTNNGSWSSSTTLDKYVNPVNSNDKLFEPTTVSVSWSGDHYQTASQNVSSVEGTKTINKDLTQTTYEKTASLETIVKEGSSPVSGANVTVKNNDDGATLKTGTTDSKGEKDFSITYQGYEFDDDATYSNISQLKVIASKDNYETNSETFNFANPMSTTIILTPIAQEYVLDTYFRLYETDGDVVSASKLPNVKFEWNGETITAQNVNGKAHIYKVYTGSNPETNVTILPPNTSEYLGTMALTTVNSSKVERLAQSATQASGMDIAVSTLNNAGDEELYLIPGTWQYAAGNLDADGTTVQGLFNRSPIAGTSSHKAVGSYPKIIVFKGSFHEETGEQFPQSIIATRDAQIDAYLSATQMPHKKLLNYEVKTFSSWTDPNWTATASGTSRNLENMTWTTFYNFDGNNIEFSLSDPEKYRILNSSSSTTNSSTPAGRMSEFFSSMTNTTGQLAQYVTNPSTGGTIVNAGKNMMGIVYIFKPATRFWQ